MTYRRQILKEVWEFGRAHDLADFVAADTLKCFHKCPTENKRKFVFALDRLLAEELLLTCQGPIERQTGKPVTMVRLNQERLGEYTKAMKFDFTRLRAAALVILVLLALFVWIKPFSLK